MITGDLTVDPSLAPVDVTVIIPTHARPQLVRRAVASAAAQDGVDFEILVIDDGSPVPAAEALAGLSDGNARRLRVLRHDAPRGVAHARNLGLQEATGTFVAFLDDDDLWAPDKLRVQLGAMADAGVDWSHTGTRWLNDRLESPWTSLPGEHAARLNALLLGNSVGTPSSVVIRTSIARQAGGFDPEFSVLADWEYWLRIAQTGAGVSVRQPLIGYVVHETSMHRQDLGAIVREYRQLKRLRGTGGPEFWIWLAEVARDRGQRAPATALFSAISVRWRRRDAARAAWLALRGTPPRPEWARDPGPEPGWVTAAKA